MKRVSLGRQVFTAYSMVYLDERSGTFSLRKGRFFFFFFLSILLEECCIKPKTDSDF